MIRKKSMHNKKRGVKEVMKNKIKSKSYPKYTTRKIHSHVN